MITNPDLVPRRWAVVLCIAIVAAFFLPWVQVVFGSVSGLDFVRLGSYGKWALLPCLLAAGCLVLAVAGAPYRSVGVLSGLTPLLGCLYLNLRASELPFGLGNAFWQVLGPGAWIMLISAAGLLLVLGFMPAGPAEAAGASVQEPSDGAPDRAVQSPAAALSFPELPLTSASAPAVASAAADAGPTAPEPAGAPSVPAAPKWKVGWIIACAFTVVALGAGGWYMKAEATRREASLLAEKQAAQAQAAALAAQASALEAQATAERQRHQDAVAALEAERQRQSAEREAAMQRHVTVTFINENCVDEAIVLDGQWRGEVTAHSRLSIPVQAGSHEVKVCRPGNLSHCAGASQATWNGETDTHIIRRHPSCG